MCYYFRGLGLGSLLYCLRGLGFSGPDAEFRTFGTRGMMEQARTDQTCRNIRGLWFRWNGVANMLQHPTRSPGPETLTPGQTVTFLHRMILVYFTHMCLCKCSEEGKIQPRHSWTRARAAGGQGTIERAGERLVVTMMMTMTMMMMKPSPH